MALTEKLSAIGDAIRAKTGGTEKLTLDAMPTEIAGIQTEPTIETLDVTSNGTYTAPDGVDGYSPITVNVPQDGSPPESAFVISGNCGYRFANGGWDWFIELYGNKITTENITTASYMFNYSKITELPFEINFKNGGGYCGHMFTGCSKLTSLPSIDFKHNSYNDISLLFSGCKKTTEIGSLKNLYPSTINAIFQNCEQLRQLPEFININFSRINTYLYCNCGYMFENCHSLRNIPEEFLKQIYGIWTTYSYSHICGFFNNCYVLDEVRGLNPQTGEIKNGSLFGNYNNGTFANCHRLKNIIFDIQNDGTPYVVKWKSQIIDLSAYIGYEYNLNNHIRIVGFNSGITADKEVTDDATYQALKNDADWFTTNVAYSRYNHDSAVTTINSLPDTSAYLASAGGTNTIKFKGAAGSATDGGAINTLTEEEIAVATAKGWTVTFV